MNDENAPTWITNANGVKSCVPLKIAEKFVSKRIGWAYAEPDAVPARKRFPKDLYLTEQGKSRRDAISKAVEEDKAASPETQPEAMEEMSFTELQALAKEKGVPNYWSKKAETLKKELGMV